MKTLTLAISALSLTLLSSLHAFASDLSEDVIYRGRPVAADGQAWKSTVSLAYQLNNGQWHGCSGTWISSDMILTAAHCEVSNRGSLSIEQWESNDGAKKQQLWLEGKEHAFEFHKHPRYIPSSGYDFGANDIAILVLKETSIPDGFEVASVYHSGVKAAGDPGRALFIAGAGRTERGEGRDMIRFAQGVIDGYEGESRMRVSFPNGQGVCKGDSGGPFFVRSGKELYLAGVLANMMSAPGSHCGQTAYGTVLTAERYDWAMARYRGVRAKFDKEVEIARKAEEAELEKYRAERAARRKAEEEARKQAEEEAAKNNPAPAPAS